MPKLLVIQLPDDEIDAEELEQRMCSTAKQIADGFTCNLDKEPLRFVIEDGMIEFTPGGVPEVELT